MNTIASLLLITALSIPTPVLVLRSGGRIDVDGNVKIEAGRVIFRSAGSLYSIPESDVDLEATRSFVSQTPVVRAEVPARLKVTPEQRDRLLRDLEHNHNGEVAPESNVPPASMTTNLAERAQNTQDEWTWKRQAQSYEETIRRACEEIDLLRSRVDELQNKIRTLLVLGYKPDSFSYDSTQLYYAKDSIPRAELELERAERDYAQFRDNARRLGVMPGWLR